MKSCIENIRVGDQIVVLCGREYEEWLTRNTLRRDGDEYKNYPVLSIITKTKPNNFIEVLLGSNTQDRYFYSGSVLKSSFKYNFYVRMISVSRSFSMPYIHKIIKAR